MWQKCFFPPNNILKKICECTEKEYDPITEEINFIQDALKSCYLFF